jgi:hypothetical protein
MEQKKKPPPRRSEQVYQRIQFLLPNEQSEALLREAANRGKSPADLVRLLIPILGVTTRDHLVDVAKLWAPRFQMTEARFVEIGERVLPPPPPPRRR